jgi:hypothetical protein
MKKEVVLILLIIIAILALLSFSRAFNGKSEDDARKFFAEDMAESYPTADVREIMDVTKVGEGPDAYYALKARVSYNLSTPCPERIEVEYNYPARNFVKRNDSVVHGCQVCLNRPHCVVSYPEEAIIASHTYEGDQPVLSYLKSYPEAKPTARLLDTYQDERNVWEVTWSDASASYGLAVRISQTRNQIIDTQQVGLKQ